MHPKWHFLLRIRSSSSASSDENELFYTTDHSSTSKHVDRQWTRRKRKVTAPKQSPSLLQQLPHSPPQEQHHVTFDKVFVREYKRIVGDHPNLEYPLGLDWKYVEFPAVPVDVVSPPATSAKYYQPVVDVSGRIHLLQQSCTMDQIRQGERRRCIQLVKEWAYRNNQQESAICDSCPNAPALFKHYIL